MPENLQPPIIHYPWYRRPIVRRLLIAFAVLLVVITLVLVVLLLLWRTSPEGRFVDVANNFLYKPATYRIKADTFDMTVVANGQRYSSTGTYDGTKVDTVLEGRYLYVSSPNPERVYRFFAASESDTPLPGFVQSVIPSLRDKWIKLDLENSPISSQNILRTQCMLERRDLFASDIGAKREWIATYLAHPFLRFKKLQEAHESSRYEVSLDKEARSSFFDALMKTNFYLSQEFCARDTDIVQIASELDPTAHITISEPEHLLKRMEVMQGGKPFITLDASYESVPAVVLPKDAVTVEELVNMFLQSAIKS